MQKGEGESKIKNRQTVQILMRRVVSSGTTLLHWYRFWSAGLKGFNSTEMHTCNWVWNAPQSVCFKDEDEEGRPDVQESKGEEHRSISGTKVVSIPNSFLANWFVLSMWSQHRKYLTDTYKYRIFPEHVDRRIWANRINPDQTSQNVASDLGLHGLLFIQHYLSCIRMTLFKIWKYCKVIYRLSENLGYIR